MTRMTMFLAAGAATVAAAIPAAAQTPYQYPAPQPGYAYPQQVYPQQGYPQQGYAYPNQGQAGVSQGKIRVQDCRCFELFDRFLQVFRRSAVPVVTSFQVRLVSLVILRVSFRNSRCFGSNQPELKLLRDGCRNFTLSGQ